MKLFQLAFLYGNLGLMGIWIGLADIFIIMGMTQWYGEKGKSRIKAVWINDVRVLLGIKIVYRMPNALVIGMYEVE